MIEINPDVICISMMSCSFNPAFRSAELAHECLPSVKIIVGGPHPSILPDEVAGYQAFDYILKGEGEISVVEMISAIENGKQLPKITLGKIPDLDKIPYADRELFGPYELNHPIEGFRAPFMTFIAGRGCKYNCSFCQPAERQIFGPHVRRRSPENFVEELLQCRERYNFNSYAIHDDCLLEDIPWVNRFADLLEKNRINVPFSCQARADLICRYPEVLKKMKSVGLSLVCVGFESGNDRVLKYIRKGIRVEQNLEAARILKTLGIKIWANYMLGIPTETIEEMDDTVRMIKQIKPDHYSPSIFTPHPGSDLYRYCTENNLLLSSSHDSFRHSITEIKIKGQNWHAIQWAVSESLKPDPDITPYSADYVSSWGELPNLANSESWARIMSAYSVKRELTDLSANNLEKKGRNSWHSMTTDPQFVWEIKPPLKPSDWRYIVIDLEVSQSSRGDIFWWTKDYKKFQSTKQFKVFYGRNTYAFDLREIRPHKNLAGDGICWDDFPVQRLRFDPSVRAGVDVTLHDIFFLG